MTFEFKKKASDLDDIKSVTNNLVLGRTGNSLVHEITHFIPVQVEKIKLFVLANEIDQTNIVQKISF